MRIAVLGATGMIGHHTAISVVARGHELTIVHRESSDMSKVQHLPYTSAIADLSDEKALREAFSNVDAVINCAAPYPTTPIPWQEEVKSSLAKMESFYKACEQKHLQKIVYLGASIALKKHPEGLPANETLEYSTAPANKNPYIPAKWAMDVQAMNKAKAGLPVVIGIPSMTFGEYDYGPSTGQLLVGVANQSLPGYVRGNRNVIYAGDAGLGLTLACEKGVPGARYLFTGNNIAMDDLVSLIAKVSKAPVLKSTPLFVAKIIAKIQYFKYKRFNADLPKISDTAIAVMSSGQFLDGTKAQKELGFKTTHSIKEAIQKAHNWFVEVGYIK